MLKSIAFNIIAVLLIFSILAPPMVTLLNNQEDSILVIDVTDEENKKESKKKFDEKELFFHSYLKTPGFHEPKLALNPSFHPFTYSDFSAEIFLPPPEHLV